MSKRKRDDSSDAAEHVSASTVDTRQLTQFRGTIEQSRKSLVAALKLARGFERQKMGRRQKNASKDPKTLLQRREEVIALKQLDLDKTAKNHILKSLLKSKRARESPIFIIVYGTQPKLDPVTTIEGVVLGRLFNSNPVKLAMSRIMAGAYEALKIEDPTKSTQQTRKAASTQGKTTTVEPPLEPDPMEITEDEDGEAPNTVDDSGEDFEQWEGILASSEDEISPEVPEAAADQRPPKNRQPKPRTPSSSPSPPPTTASTAFLPTLNMGGYYSGSDSSDEEKEKSHGPAKPKERKNRRGQRARQQLAELKHGKNAKHLQKQNNSRDSGWDRRKGAVGVSGRANHKPVTYSKSSKDSNGPATQPPPKKRDDSGPLHPSWEAAKQRKMQSAAPAAFEGKKITFD